MNDLKTILRLKSDVQAEDASPRIKESRVIVRALFDEISKLIVGQQDLVSKLLIGILCNGHILVEGVPGLAKTTMVKALAQVIQTRFQRIQFTPDLLPADIIGTQIYQPALMTFCVKKGPIFSNIILADEINRAPAKVQSALLEAMQERQVTIGEETFALDDPFLVIATQNPIEAEGTYPLPEAQLDRFLLKVLVTYPSREEEKEIVRRVSTNSSPALRPLLGLQQLLEMRLWARSVYLDDKLLDYITDIVAATRAPKDYDLPIGNWISYGASPRASIYLAETARSRAFLEGRDYVVPHDIKMQAPDVLRHRIVLSCEAEAEGKTADDLVAVILKGISVP